MGVGNYYNMDIKHLVKLIKPALDCSGGKGDLGKLAFIGGSFEYTGAPYYSAIASLKCLKKKKNVYN